MKLHCLNLASRSTTTSPTAGMKHFPRKARSWSRDFFKILNPLQYFWNGWSCAIKIWPVDRLQKVKKFPRNDVSRQTFSNHYSCIIIRFSRNWAQIRTIAQTCGTDFPIFFNFWQILYLNFGSAAVAAELSRPTGLPLVPTWECITLNWLLI